jgi:hypothetical protein
MDSLEYYIRRNFVIYVWYLVLVGPSSCYNWIKWEGKKGVW